MYKDNMHGLPGLKGQPSIKPQNMPTPEITKLRQINLVPYGL